MAAIATKVTINFSNVLLSEKDTEDKVQSDTLNLGIKIYNFQTYDS